MALGDLIGRLLGSNQTFMPGEQQVAQGGSAASPLWGQVTNDLSAPASSPSLFGVPIMPLLAGVGGAFLNQSLAKRAHRNEALGSGFAGMYSLFNEPIRRQQAEARRMTELGIQQGWFSPYAQAVPKIPQVQIDPNSLTPAGASGISGNAPLVSAVPNAVPPAPPQESVGYGGRTLYLNRGITVGDMYPGVAMPPDLAAQRMPMSPELANKAALGAKEMQARSFYGAKPNEPIESVMDRYLFELHKGRVADAVKNLPTGENVTQNMKIGPDGSVTQGADTLAPAALAAIQDQAALRKIQMDELGLKKEDRLDRRNFVTNQGYPVGTPIEAVSNEWAINKALTRMNTEQAKVKSGNDTSVRVTFDQNGLPRKEYVTKAPSEIIEAKEERKLKRKEIDARIAELKAQSQAHKDQIKQQAQALNDENLRGLLNSNQEQQRGLRLNIEKMREATALGQLDANSPDLASAQDQLNDATDAFSIYQKELATRGKTGQPTPNALSRPEQKMKDQVLLYKDAIKKLPDVSQLDKIQQPTTPEQIEAWGYATEGVKAMLDAIVSRIETMSEPSVFGRFGSRSISSANEKFLKKLYPDDYDYAKKQWQQGYKPHVAISPAPISPVPTPPIFPQSRQSTGY